MYHKLFLFLLTIGLIGYHSLPTQAQYITHIPEDSDSTFYRVDLAIKNAPRCAYLYLEYDSIKYLPDNFSLLTNLRGITFKYCNKVDWPRAFGVLGNLPKLEYFEMSVCKVNKLSERINKLKKIKSLVLKTNGFLTVPENISELNRLQYVNLSFNPGMKWEEVLSRISINIMELDLSGNSLSELPPAIYQYSQLRTLHLQSNYIKLLPPSFGEFEQLTYLNLSNNPLMNWKSSFEAVIKLRQLNILKISNNDLIELPARLGALTNLKELHADGNRLSALPESIGLLADLRVLNINASNTGMFHNQIEKFPASFSKLTKLEILNMNGTYMQNLPSGLDKLTGLKIISIEWCGLTSLNELKNCTKLEELYASHNYFDRIPEWIGNLSSLRILRLDGNFFPNKPIPHILSCPSGIGNLQELEILSLNDQLIDKLPDEIGNLKKLKVLNIRNNKLETLPASIAQCTSLEVLDLKANLLTSLPDLNALSNLKDLNISFNPDLNIDKYAGAFSKLSSLKKLDISYNNVSEITLKTISKQYPDAEIYYLSTKYLKFNPDRK